MKVGENLLGVEADVLADSHAGNFIEAGLSVKPRDGHLEDSCHLLNIH